MRWETANEARSAKLAIIISYPTSASGRIVLLKTSKSWKTALKWVERRPQKLTRTLTIFVGHGIMAHLYYGHKANQIPWIALYNDPVFNNAWYPIFYGTWYGHCNLTWRFFSKLNVCLFQWQVRTFLCEFFISNHFPSFCSDMLFKILQIKILYVWTRSKQNGRKEKGWRTAWQS